MCLTEKPQREERMLAHQTLQHRLCFISPEEKNRLLVQSHDWQCIELLLLPREFLVPNREAGFAVYHHHLKEGERFSSNGCPGVGVQTAPLQWVAWPVLFPFMLMATQWWVSATEMGRARSREWLSLSTQSPSLLCYHCPPCLHLFYLFVAISGLCLQHEVQSLVSTKVTWYRLAANLEKETLSPIAEKQGFQMEAAQLLSSSILPLKKAEFAILNRTFHPLRTVPTGRNHLLVDQKSEKWSSSPWCCLAILQSCLCGRQLLLGSVDICLSPCDMTVLFFP